MHFRKIKNVTDHIIIYSYLYGSIVFLLQDIAWKLKIYVYLQFFSFYIFFESIHSFGI